jgi:hypothetical protein
MQQKQKQNIIHPVVTLYMFCKRIKNQAADNRKSVSEYFRHILQQYVWYLLPVLSAAEITGLRSLIKHVVPNVMLGKIKNHYLFLTFV